MAGLFNAEAQARKYCADISEILSNMVSNKSYFHDGEAANRQIAKIMCLSLYVQIMTNDSDYVVNYFESNNRANKVLADFADRYGDVYKDINFGMMHRFEGSVASERLVTTLVNCFNMLSTSRVGSLAQPIRPTYSARFTLNGPEFVRALTEVADELLRRQEILNLYYNPEQLFREASHLSRERSGVVRSARASLDESAAMASPPLQLFDTEAKAADSDSSDEDPLETRRRQVIPAIVPYVTDRLNDTLSAADFSKTAPRISFDTFKKRVTATTVAVVLGTAFCATLFTTALEHGFSKQYFNYEGEGKLKDYGVDILARVLTAGAGLLLAYVGRQTYLGCRFNQFMKPPTHPASTTAETPLLDKVLVEDGSGAANGHSGEQRYTPPGA